MDPPARPSVSSPPARARPPPLPPPPRRDALPTAGLDDELYDCLDYNYLRDFPASGAGRSKGRTRREQQLRTNYWVPGGHERKVAQTLINGQRKRRQRQLQPRPRTHLS